MIKLAEIGKRIATLRKAKGYSQEEMAKVLKITRPSLTQIELGNRNISAAELVRLSSVLHISIDKLLGAHFDEPTILPERKDKTESRVEERVAIPYLKTEKFKEVLLYVLERSAGKPNVGETVLYKLMYFIEFNFYERYEEHMIGATFKKLQFGPVPQKMDTILSQMEKDKTIQVMKTDYHGYPQKRYIPLAKPNLKKLNAAEIETIDQVISQLSDFSAKAISDYSHKDMPWKATKEGEIIDYELAFYREPPFSARVYDNDERE